MKFKKFLILTVILLTAAFLRFYKLGEIPNGLYVDEAAIGYNAYSFWQTGKDEYGKAFPVFLRSYEAYAPPLYTYFSTASVFFFGLNPFATRFISALSGVFLVLMIFLIAEKIKFLKKNYFSLVASFLFAVSPWTIFFSRGAYEANLAFLLLMVAIYFLLLAKERLIYLVPALFFFSISTYAYQAERVVVYLILLGFFLSYFRKSFWKTIVKKETIVSLFIFIIFQLPQIALLFSPAFKLRAAGLFYKEAVFSQAEKIHLPKAVSYPLTLLREFSANFVTYFSPRNLFWEGDSDLQRGLPETGPFYFWLVIPYLIGLWIIAKRHREKDFFFLITLGLSFVLVPALTKDPFSTLRSLPLAFPLVITISLGLGYSIERFPKLSIWGLVLLSWLSFILFWRSYFVLLPHERAKIWGYGFEELAAEIEKRPGEVFIIDQSRAKPVYIELAFYLRYPPEKFQAAVDQSIKDNYYTNTKFDSHYRFANLETRGIEWEKDIYRKQILVGDELSISKKQAKEHFLIQVFEIKDPVGEIVFQGFRTNPDLKCRQTNFKSIYCSQE